MELDVLRHSAAHILAAAVKELYPSCKLGMGPSIEDGFYYDFDNIQITNEDLPKIESKMRELISKDEKFIRKEVSKKEAEKILKAEKYKLELLKDIEKPSLYETGKFIDLCAGPHVKSSRDIKAIKLLGVAGAYWKGDSKNKMLVRIYGTAFGSEKELNDYLKLMEEAEKRNHVKIGEEMELFALFESIGKGLPVWLPKGEIIRQEIEKFAIETENKHGYVRVSTPNLAKKELFVQSGHLPYYKDSMYPEMKMDDGVYYLKAMNCPMHHLVYSKKQRSYRELPLRIAEYGTCYRNELSGTLTGLLRVRILRMNDAHIYCMKEQIEQEVEGVLKLIKFYYDTFGFKNYSFRLSLHGEGHKDKYIDEPENWKYSEEILRKVLKKLKLPFTEALDEAAFYGPKIDIQLKNVYGREETMSTVQLDFAAKKRFSLHYFDADGAKNEEVFVIHRAPLSTHERFMAFLIENYAGKFPVWLSPVQVVLMPIADRHNKFAENLMKKFEEKGIRVKLDDRSESINKKVREAQLQKIPYMITIGDKEIEKNDLAVRTRDGNVENIKTDKFILKILEEISTKKC